PEVPTFAESGLKDEVLQITGPIALVAPARTPAAVVDRIGREVARIARSPEMVQNIENIGMEALGTLPAEAKAGYEARLPVFLKSVRDTGVTID
ncbi:MAG TPA: tripartite tricarboxylate transporter substrate-binding protein, partial [Pseudorhodoferax sp.]|nr:tripartite tricarboxylate transporter substrate-binding protein [Pseudorhodoferax sp.]